MIRILLLFLLGVASQADVLFPSGSEWRWRPGMTEASSPVSAWRTVSFEESGFTAAPAPFWYGDPYPGGTQISGMRNIYLSIFLRKTFVVTNVAQVESLQLSAVVDDGFVAWINGTEVQRVNMPGKPGTAVSITTLADNAVEPVAFETYELRSPAAYLVPGTNIIAMQVFQSSLNSSDLGFDCSLEAVYREPVPDLPPAVASLVPAAGATVRSLREITVLFNEAVTGVEAADLLVNGSPAASAEMVTPSQYVFRIPAVGPGAVEVRWAADHGIRDFAATPRLFEGGSWSYTLDPTAPEAAPYISELMAANAHTLADEDGDYPDWIEIYNPGSVAVNLDGWALTDTTNRPSKWRFPAISVGPGAFLVVFASEKDRRIPGARLHTNFKLGAEGEYLALIKADGSVASEFAPRFPPQVADVSFGLAQLGAPPFTTSQSGVYFTAPSPGEANVGGVDAPGPVILEVQHAPRIPLENDDLFVTARVSASFQAVQTVSMRYRVMFGTEVTAPMFDDGAHGDGAAGDGVFGSRVPASASTSGQMVRYYISAADVSGNTSRWPLFTDRNSTAEYLGTVINPAYVTSAIPVIHLFAPPSVLQPGPNTASIGADSQGGSRGVSVYYDGEFYDNVYVALRGNTTAVYPKKSHRFEFNREHLFRHPGVGYGWPEKPGSRIRKTSFVADYPDPTYMRQGLSFWLCQEIGSPASFYYPVRLQLNGAFYQLANHNDVHGEGLLDRLGYDPNGALYNAVGSLQTSRSSTGGFEKKTRTWEGDSDYMHLAEAIVETASLGTRRTNVFDMLDLPNVISYLVAARFVQENDDVWANMSIYHDNEGDDLWRIVSFDMNLSWGAFYYDNPQYDQGIQATNDNHKSFPLYGSSQARTATEGTFNRMYDVIFDVPQTLEMFRRRMRTVLDEYVLPPGAAPNSSRIEQKILGWRDRILADAPLDRAKWGWPGIGGQNNLPPASLEQGVTDLLQKFFYLRREHFYGKHSITNTALPVGTAKTQNAGIPLPQAPSSSLEVAKVEFNPASGNQDEEFICFTNPAPVAVDISGWNVEGAVNFRFKPGTVVPANSDLYLSPNVRAFRGRAVSPRGREGHFVVGPYSGQLSARGETIVLRNAGSNIVHTSSFSGAPSSAQQFMRVTEIMYNPAASAGDALGAEAYEFIEVKNISTNTAVDLAGLVFTNGVFFDFSQSSVKTLEPQSSLVLVRNRQAFSTRYGAERVIAGEYAGALDNAGERIRLVDASNEEVLDFTYNNSWYPETDGQGASLLIVNEHGEPDSWTEKAAWRPFTSGPGGDSDGDGMPDAAEAIAGTDPFDPASLLKLVADPVGVAGARLQFQAIAGHSYTIESADALAAAIWQKLADVEAPAQSRVATIEDPLGSAHRFYRLVTPKR